MRAYRIRWLKALVSGKYKQAKGVLEFRHKGKTTRYCCLGVLCKVLRAKRVEIGQNAVSYGGEISRPPAKITAKVGLTSFDVTDLIDMNDVHFKTFEQIARHLARKWRITNKEIGLKRKNAK